jgi:hypothetical protein
MSNSSVSPQPDDLMKDDSNNNNNWILLDHCDLKGMNIIVDQSSGNVVTFSTRYCRDTERWRGEMPSLIQVNGTNFRTLQTLDLHNSRYLVALSSTLGLQVPLLRRLILTRCNRLERLPESICSLQYLEEVNVKNPLLTTRLFVRRFVQPLTTSIFFHAIVESDGFSKHRGAPV